MTTDKAKRFERYLVWGIILIDLLFAMITIIFLTNSRAHYIERLEINASNLVRLLEQGIADRSRLIDNAVLRVEKELSHQIASADAVDGIRLTQFLNMEQEELPEIDAIRVTNAAGDVLWGKGIVPGVTVSYSDREFFKTHQKHTTSDLIITEPIKGKVSGRWIIAFTRCYRTKDGQFAGVISAAVPVETFDKLLVDLHLGKSGTVVLRYADMGLIARDPPIDGPAGIPGHKKVSPEYQKLVESGVPVAIFHTPKAPDNVERTYAFRRVSGWPFTIAVGLVESDHLTPWRTELAWASILLAGFYFVTLAFAWTAKRHLCERAALERAQIEDLTRRRILIDQSRDGIVVLDERGKVWEANRRFADMLRYTPKEVAQLYVWDWDARHSREEIEVMIKEIDPSGAHFETTHRRKDGTLFEVELSNNGAIVGEQKLIFCVCRDITDRRQAEAEKDKLESQLRHVQKLEAIGTLAGGIAHDFNNILAAILGYTELVIGDMPPDSPSRNDLEQVLIATLRAKDLVRQILAVSRQGLMEARQPVLVTSVVKEALKLLRATLPTTIEFREDISKKIGTVMGDPSQLHQIIVNLGTNAAHAMRETGGIFEVILEQIELDSITADKLDHLKPGPFVKLTVTDTGHGIDPAIRERIFDPYFTTKEVGEGSGLGLAVVQGIVKRHGGTISVRSEIGKGSIFEILIPVYESDTELKEEIQKPVPRGNERILLIDDEKSLATLGERLLVQLGYQITTQTSSVEAMALFEADPKAFDLVITDYTMPHLTGVGLAKTMLQIRPDIPIILCTGYSEMINETTAKEFGIRAFVMKPFSRQNIAMVIREILDEK